jgi:hypothetical protein
MTHGPHHGRLDRAEPLANPARAKEGDVMRRLRMFLVGMLTLALLGGLGGAGTAQDEMPGVRVETLSDHALIPVEAIPEMIDHLALWRTWVEPGTTGELGSEHPSQGIKVAYVESGAVTLERDGDTTLWRGDGSVEAAPAGTPYSLGSGDTSLERDGTSSFSFEVPAEDGVVILYVGMSDSIEPAEAQQQPPGVSPEVLAYVFPDQADLEHLLSRPIGVSFERVTLDPGAQLVLGLDEVPMLSFIRLESGKLKYDEVPATEVSQADPDFTLWSGDTWTGQTPAAGNVHVLRNEGDEPAVALAVVLSHVSED